MPDWRRTIELRIVGARGRVRDMLRADGLDARVGGLDRSLTIDSLLADRRTQDQGVYP
jgi:hypothetical protein